MNSKSTSASHFFLLSIHSFIRSFCRRSYLGGRMLVVGGIAAISFFFAFQRMERKTRTREREREFEHTFTKRFFSQ